MRNSPAQNAGQEKEILFFVCDAFLMLLVMKQILFVDFWID